MDLQRVCQDSPKLLDTILSCIQHVVVVADLKGRILFVNPVVEEVFGFRPDELKEKELSILFTPEDLTCLYPNLLYMAGQNRRFEGELMLMDKHKKRFFAFMVFRPWVDPEEGKTVVALSIRNIDKRKQLEKTFTETPFQDLVKLADGVAHELRNPLVAIGGSANRLYKLCKNHKEQAVYYERIVDNLARIERIIKKVEFFAHLPRPALKQESLGKLIQKALRPYLQQIQKQKIDLKIDVEDLMLFIDEELIATALSILIDNSLFALQHHGTIQIRNEIKDDQCELYVSDTGSGITPENLTYIFKPFFSTKSDGAGLDLAVLKRIMERHGGQVEVQSEAGKGTTFLLIFPLERRRSLRIRRLEDWGLD